jgi:hypothetical protein
MLADAANDPSDPLPPMALADYISDLPKHSLGPIRRDRLPRWLQRAWSRARRADPRTARGAWGGLDVEWVALKDLGEWFTAEGRRLGAYWYLDTWCGSREVGGLDCFVSMLMTAGPETLRKQAAALAGKARCVGVVLPDAREGGGEVYLLPTPKQVARRKPKA